MNSCNPRVLIFPIVFIFQSIQPMNQMVQFEKWVKNNTISSPPKLFIIKYIQAEGDQNIIYY